MLGATRTSVRCPARSSTRRGILLRRSGFIADPSGSRRGGECAPGLSDERDLTTCRAWGQIWQSAIVNSAKRSAGQHLRAVAHPTRRDGATAVALLVVPWVVALVLVRRHHHLDGGTIGILVAVSLGLPTLWVTWAAYRGPRRADALKSAISMAQTRIRE